ncbi:hypothetical protein H0H81_005631 [Sphagnurus paluster]|uniref:Store-operated calcium entry-associated regulatory factor n=1 Tax=Sphagnurus paluster TaxID=117069 RepID=A0A9P7FY00_9AGAR|nr:hypothetical protein H0H81_005631 [Sphagnurus paluster]
MSRLELSKIPSLTFYQDSLTAARRTSPVPQLVCQGAPCKLYKPEVVRCVSLPGGYGTEVDWKDLARWSIVWFKFPAFFVALITLQSPHCGWTLSCLRRNDTTRSTPPPTVPRPGSGFTGGWFPGGMDNHSSPPPPYSKNAAPENQGWRPGFWTGAAVGGALNHALNRRQAQQQPVPAGSSYDWERPQARSSIFSSGRSSDRGEGSSNLGSMRRSTALGGSNPSASSTSTTPPAATTTNSAVCSGTLTKFKYFGVNQSGAEFGNQNIPGVLGTDYTWPAPSSIDVCFRNTITINTQFTPFTQYFVGQGFNTFRVAFQQERISPPSNGLTGTFDATYLAALKTVSNILTVQSHVLRWSIDRELHHQQGCLCCYRA